MEGLDRIIKEWIDRQMKDGWMDGRVDGWVEVSEILEGENDVN